MDNSFEIFIGAAFPICFLFFACLVLRYIHKGKILFVGCVLPPFTSLWLIPLDFWTANYLKSAMVTQLINYAFITVFSFMAFILLLVLPWFVILFSDASDIDNEDELNNMESTSNNLFSKIIFSLIRTLLYALLWIIPLVFFTIFVVAFQNLSVMPWFSLIKEILVELPKTAFTIITIFGMFVFCFYGSIGAAWIPNCLFSKRYNASRIQIINNTLDSFQTQVDVIHQRYPDHIDMPNDLHIRLRLLNRQIPICKDYLQEQMKFRRYSFPLRFLQTIVALFCLIIVIIVSGFLIISVFHRIDVKALNDPCICNTSNQTPSCWLLDFIPESIPYFYSVLFYMLIAFCLIYLLLCAVIGAGKIGIRICCIHLCSVNPTASIYGIVSLLSLIILSTFGLNVFLFELIPCNYRFGDVSFHNGLIPAITSLMLSTVYSQTYYVISLMCIDAYFVTSFIVALCVFLNRDPLVDFNNYSRLDEDEVILQY